MFHPAPLSDPFIPKASENWKDLLGPVTYPQGILLSCIPGIVKKHVCWKNFDISQSQQTVIGNVKNIAGRFGVETTRFGSSD